MNIECTGKLYDILNQEIFAQPGDVTLNNCIGQRFIGAGAEDRTITINGIPGNALGAYLNGANIVVNGNAQDATGDTMNAGRIVIHGRCGDAAGYAMRGGEIFIEGDVGYRAGIHMKAYRDKYPVLVFGGRSGSFLGEYQAGGLIIALGLHCREDEIIGNFCATGMHGGRIMIRADRLCARISKQIESRRANDEDMALAAPYIKAYCGYFHVPEEAVYNKSFFVLTPNSSNPYKQLYIQN